MVFLDFQSSVWYKNRLENYVASETLKAKVIFFWSFKTQKNHAAVLFYEILTVNLKQLNRLHWWKTE